MADKTEATYHGDTMPQWLYNRYGKMRLSIPWNSLPIDDKAYWHHEADAVRRAVARGGFKVRDDV